MYISTVDIIRYYYDQLMLLYDLIESYDYISVIDNSTNRISFQVFSHDQQTINRLIEKINSHKSNPIYGKPILSEYYLKGNDSVIISMVKLI